MRWLRCCSPRGTPYLSQSVFRLFFEHDNLRFLLSAHVNMQLFRNVRRRCSVHMEVRGVGAVWSHGASVSSILWQGPLTDASLLSPHQHSACIPGRRGQDREKGHQITAKGCFCSQVDASDVWLALAFLLPAYVFHDTKYCFTTRTAFLRLSLGREVFVFSLTKPMDTSDMKNFRDRNDGFYF